MNHLDHILSFAPEIKIGHVLDLGSGRGDFLIEASRRGIQVVGLEPNPEYIRTTKENALKAGITVEVEQGIAEWLPAADNSLDFININEVIEHVENPDRLLREVARVLKVGGKAYLSVPNRFGFRDQHFHLYFLNWLPRSLADAFISIFGKHKDYKNMSAGRQRLADMHYYTYSKTVSSIRQAGLQPIDIRHMRLQKERSRIQYMLVVPVYLLARTLYFDAFHILLEKKV